MTNNNNKVSLSESGLKADLDLGLSRKAMAEKYNLPVVQIKKALEQAGFKNLKAKKQYFELVKDITYLNADTTHKEILNEVTEETANPVTSKYAAEENINL